MEDDLQAALEVLIQLDDVDGIFDRKADEGGYKSEALESALDVVRRHLPAQDNPALVPPTGKGKSGGTARTSREKPSTMPPSDGRTGRMFGRQI